MANYTTLSTAIKSLLQGVSNLNYIYEFEKPLLEGFPCATITPSESEVDKMDTGNNFRNFTFNIRIYQEIAKDDMGPDEGERIMRETVDAILLKFDQNITLSGTCIMVEPIPGKWGWYERDMNIRVAEIIVKCKVKVSRS